MSDKTQQNATAARQRKHRDKRRAAGYVHLYVSLPADTKRKLDALTQHWCATQRGAITMLVNEAVKRLNLVTE